MPKKRPLEERMQLLAEVNKLCDEGITITEAVKKVGINQSNYHTWSTLAKTRKPKRSAVTVFDLPVAPKPAPKAEKIICVIGSAAEVADVIRGIK